MPFRDHFESLPALLARIAEDPTATGFAGVVLRNDGDDMVLTTFNVTRSEVAMAALMLQANAMEEADDVL